MLDFAQHAQHVEATVASRSAAARCRIAASWTRSKNLHLLDPANDQTVHRLSDLHLKPILIAARPLMSHATPEMDRLFKLLGRSGSALFLANADGIILDQRTNMPARNIFAKIGLGVGADCAEKREGTNSIGTCIAEDMVVVIDRDQHFFARNRAITSIATPIFGTEGVLIGVLAYATSEPVMHPGSHPLIVETLRQASKRIESALFRHVHADHRIMVAPESDAEDVALLAVDRSDFVIGATRAARQALRCGLGDTFAPRPAADLLGKDEPARDMHDIRRAAILHALHAASGNVSAAARQLGLGRATLYNQMKRLNIRP